MSEDGHESSHGRDAVSSASLGAATEASAARHRQHTSSHASSAGTVAVIRFDDGKVNALSSAVPGRFSAGFDLDTLVSALGRHLPRSLLAHRLIKPATILRSHRRLLAKRWTCPHRSPTHRRRDCGDRPARQTEPTWSYQRIQGELPKVRQRVGASTIGGLGTATPQGAHPQSDGRRPPKPRPKETIDQLPGSASRSACTHLQTEQSLCVGAFETAPSERVQVGARDSS